MQDRPLSHGRYHRPAVEPVAALLAAATGALVAWVVPVTAVVLVWPFLFFVPGWVVVRRVVPDLPMPGAVGAAIVVSVYASAHLVNLVARVAGFGRPAIIVSALSAGDRVHRAGPGASSMAGATRAPVPRRRRRGAGEPIGRPGSSPPSIALVVLVVLWSERLGAGTRRLGHRRLELERPAGPRGDRFEHRRRQLPARRPLLRRRAADVPLVRRLPRRRSPRPRPASTSSRSTSRTSALFAGVLALVVWALASRLTGDRRVATIATILVCAGGGLGWIRLVGDVIAGAGSPFDLVGQPRLVRQHLGRRLAVLQDRLDLRDRVPAASGDDPRVCRGW